MVPRRVRSTGIVVVRHLSVVGKGVLLLIFLCSAQKVNFTSFLFQLRLIFWKFGGARSDICVINSFRRLDYR
jgi:hypothetical protein